MALDTLPPWLTDFTSPTQILSAGNAAGARDYANQLQSRQLQLDVQRHQAAQAQAQSEAAIRAQEQAQQFQLESAKFQMLKNAQDEKAQKEALRFAGITGLQNELDNGGKFEEVFPKYATTILGGTPGAFEDYITGQSKINAQGKIDAANNQNKLQLAQIKGNKTASQRDAEYIIDLENRAKSLDEENPDEAQRLRDISALMREQMKGVSEVIGYDENGKPMITRGKGSQASQIGQPTMAVKTDAQKKLTKYENSVELITRLEKNLRPQDVGVQGTMGDIMVDKGLAQLIPGIADKERISNRTALVAMKEGLMREVSDDTRFSNADREEIAKALPSTGIFESHEDAMKRLGTVKQILRDRGLVYGKSIGVTPEFTLTPEQIAKEVGKTITREKAIELLRRFHGFE